MRKASRDRPDPRKSRAKFARIEAAASEVIEQGGLFDEPPASMDEVEDSAA